MMDHEILSRLPESVQAIYQHCELSYSADRSSAVLICESEQAAAFCSQLYFLTLIYPLIKKREPTVRNLYVFSGSVYDLIVHSKATFVSIT